MTREEAINTLATFKRYISGGGVTSMKDTQAINMAIEALSREPSEDVISRQAAIDVIEAGRLTKLIDAETAVNGLKALPSAQPTDAEIQRMQDIEQAALEKVYECGKQDAQHWISCEERLPEEEKAYLVTFACEKVGMSSWHKDTFNRGFNRGFDAYLTGVTEDGECEYFGVVAWMEKPEPWKGGPEADTGLSQAEAAEIAKELAVPRREVRVPEGVQS